MVVCQEWNKQDFNFQNVYLENLFMQWALKQFCFEEIRRIEEMRRILWQIVKYRASVLWMNINVHEFCCFLM
jgi:hypothetical protein